MPMKKARILVETPFRDRILKPNQVIEAPADDVNVLSKAGFADPNRAAVDYCLSESESALVRFEDRAEDNPRTKPSAPAE